MGELIINYLAGESVEQYANNHLHQASVMAYDENDFMGEKCREVVGSNAQIGGCSEWTLNPTFTSTSFVNGISYSFSDSQSDGDMTPSASFIDGPGPGPATRWP